MKDKAWAALLPGLGLLVGFVYYWSNNVTYFTGTAFLASFLLLLGAGLGLFVFCGFIVPWVLQEFLREKYQRPFFALIVAALLAACTFCIVNFHLWHQKRLWGAGLLILAFLLLMRGLQRPMAIFLCVLLAIPSGTFLYRFITLHYQQAKIFAALEQEDAPVPFVRKPNIYIYWLESYQDLNMLRSVFHMDVDGFEKFLLANHFQIREDVYSSGSHTLAAMSQLYAQKRLDGPEFNTSEALWETRNLIGGSAYNYVYRILKNSGYRTYLIFQHEQEYYLHEKGKNLDEVAFSPTIVGRYFLPILTFIYPSLRERLGYADGPDQKYIYLKEGYPQDFVEKIEYAISRARTQGQPYIFSFKGGAFHTPSDGSYDWKQRDAWIGGQSYQTQIKASNRETEEILTYIIQNDPASIILLLGDHGPYTYRAFPLHEEKFFKEAGISPKDIMDDTYNVFFAWRMPDGCADDLSQGMYMNNVNVLTHIFAWMANDPALLETRARSESIYGSFKAVEGVIQEAK